MAKAKTINADYSFHAATDTFAAAAVIRDARAIFGGRLKIDWEDPDNWRVEGISDNHRATAFLPAPRQFKDRFTQPGNVAGVANPARRLRLNNVTRRRPHIYRQCVGYLTHLCDQDLMEVVAFGLGHLVPNLGNPLRCTLRPLPRGKGVGSIHNLLPE